MSEPAVIDRIQSGFRLSPQQRRLWTLWGQGGAAAQCVLRVEGQLDVSRLERALQGLVERHEILRTEFHQLPGMKVPVQCVSPEGGVALRGLDVSGAPSDLQDARLDEQARAEGLRPLDPGELPLRILLVRRSEFRHDLILTLPALCADRESLRILARETADFYGAPEDPGLDEPFQYADFAEWQNELLEGEDREEAGDHWRDWQAQAVVSPGLPLARQVAPAGLPEPRALSLEVGAEILGRLESVVGWNGCGLADVLLTAWQTLLCRLTGEPGLVVGAVFDGRKYEPLEGALGPCAKTLPVLSRFDGRLTFGELLREVAGVLREAHEHQELFDPDGSVRFDCLFDFDDRAVSFAAGGVALSVVRRSCCQEAFALALTGERRDGGLVLEILYDGRRFMPGDARYLADCFATLLASLATKPDSPLEELEILSQEMRRRIAIDWNSTDADYPREGCIDHLVEAQAERTPEAVAVVDREQEIRYGELDRRANRLAHALRRLGVGPESVVGLCLESSVERIVAVLAVWKAGGAYVALDPEAPTARKALLLEASRARVVLTEEALWSKLPGFDGEIVCLDRQRATLSAESDQRPARLSGPDNLAYIVFTSGSTGTPKGVLAHHRGVVSYLTFLVSTYGLNGADRVLQLAALPFDASVRDTLGPLAAGASVILVDRMESRDSVALLRTIRQRGITAILSIVPSLLRTLADGAAEGDLPYGTVRLVLVSGERLYRSDCVKAWRLFGERVAVVNQYGPTECTMTSSFYRTDPTESDREVTLLGRPIANSKFYLLDHDLQLVPIGVTGELCIAGVGVARGYLGRPDLTAERFLPDPFGGEPGARMYRTGDQVRSLLDGNFEFLGRFDHQVKIRGFRIEPGEIEAALRRHPAVREAAVVTLGAGDQDIRLVAYLGIGRSVPPGISELRAGLEETLPAYMVPAAFVFLPNLPLTPNGKVDRRALPVPEEIYETAERRYVTPRTPAEEVLAEIWAEVLGGSHPGREDDFFALGGHSLLATQIMARVRSAFEVELPLQAIFEQPILSGLAERIDMAMRDGGAPRAPRPERLPRDEKIPLSFAQERLWFLAQLEPENPAYNVPMVLHLEGGLDLQAIEWGLTELRCRHEALRTTYEIFEGRPVQVIQPAAPWRLRRVDLTGLAGEEQEREAQRLMREEFRHPFDLATGPLARATLMHLGERDHLALFTIHHIASDAWSTGVMVRELSELYRSRQEGVLPNLPELPIQYADYALWQRSWVSGEIVAAQLAYWRERLHGVSALELPTDRPRPAVLTPSGAVRVFGLTPASAALQKALGRREGVTLFMTFWAGFAALLCRYTSRNDVAVGTPVAGRHHVETENLIGCLVNTLVLRADLSGDPSFRELLRRVRKIALEAHSHQDLPFERLADELEPERAMNRTPLFQVMFSLQNAPSEDLELPGLRLRQWPADTRTAKFDLELNIHEVGDRLAGSMTYSTDLFDATTIDRMLGHLALLLEEAAREPVRRISELPFLGPEERQQLLVEWNEGSGLLSLEECVLHRFEEQAESTPSAVAAVFGEARLTYGRLRERTGRLASTLASAGVERGSIVCLLAERGIDFLTAVLALFKAGAAYLPLDPRHPAPRLARVVDQSGSSLVLAATGFLPLLSEALADIPPERSPWVLDLDDALANGRGDLRSAPCCEPGDLAYVIYTSGSTGVPKGVMVEHRGMLNHLAAKIAELGLTAADRVAQTASQTFDISVWQFLAALLVGGRVHIVPDDVAHDPALLLDEIESAGISVLETVPSLLRALLDEVRRRGEEAPRLSSLRWLIPTGEALPPELCREWLSFYPGVPLLNAYGPTECSDDVSHHVLRQPPEEGCLRIPIGRPLPNLALYVLEPSLSPLPMQVPGELCAGGAGVGRGYLNDPGTTAERFVPDPFAGTPGARMYRTGDLACRLPEGTIDFLGRLDHQVKIRGFRIELQEIETTLAAHPAVRTAAVVARETERKGDLMLVAYVVPDPEHASAAGEPGFVSPAVPEEQWRTVFDEVYRHGAVSDRDPGVNLRVWISSYTGLPFPEEEIFESVEDSVARILALAPSRVLEIGCGTGLLLSRIAPHCAEYWGTDISEEALLAVRRRLAQRGDGLESRVRLLPGAADRLDELPERFFDAVVLNEVVQYFPGADYLARVLTAIVERVRPGGTVFAGGLRSFPLLAAFHASVQLFQASDSLPVDELRQRVLAQAAQEKELAVSPSFFLALRRQLPRVSAVRFLLKGGRSRNEFTRFRYDAILEIEGSSTTAGELPRLDWDRELDLAALRRYLEERSPLELEVADLPNLRTLEEVLVLDLLDQGIGETVGDLRQLLREQLPGGGAGIDPEDLRDLGRELGYEVDVTWAVSGHPERFDAVLRKPGVKPRESRVPSGPELSWDHYTNHPRTAGPLPQLAPELRGHLARRLPDYMIPTAFVMLEALPLTPNGKLDRKALPAPVLKRESAGTVAEPLSLTEELLAAMWAPLLGVEAVEREEGFFALGGHSLLATQLLSRIREVFRVDLPLRAVFEEPTLAGLAGRIDQASRRGAGLGTASTPRLQPVPRNRDLPLSFAQQRLWFLDQLEPGNPTYNVPTAVRLHGKLNVEALARAFSEIVRRHEVLRTTFSKVRGEAVQLIHSSRPQALPVIDLTAVPELAREGEALDRVAVESRRSFDLAKGPLLYTSLLRLGREDHVLLVTMHHIVSDGWSIEILIRELATLYRTFLAGKPSPLPKLPVQYADFAVWQREWLSGEVLERHLEYWRRQLAGTPPVLDLPTDRPRPPVVSYQGASHRFALPEPLTQALAELSRSQGTTLFMTLLGGFQALLARYSGQEDICVGAPVAGRTQLETENLIGFLVNTLVLRGDLTGEPTFRQLLARVREVALDAHTYQHLPFEKLVEELRPERTLSYTPLFQVVCVLQNVPHESLELPGLALTPFGGQSETAKFDLVLSFQEVAHGLAGSLVYNTDLFDASTVERMARHLSTFLEELVAAPDLSFSTAPLFAAAEREAAAFPWNAAHTDYPVEGCLHDLFAAQAERRPNAVAAVCGEESLTYGDLHQQARRLASHLRSLGVGPEVLVGLCVERSLDILVGILGILQAGGAYLPLDPAYPQERLAYLVSDSRTPLILGRRSLLGAFPETGARIVLLDDERLFADGAPDLPARDATPEHPAYMIYTSGSTGQPKGVVVSHANVIRLFRSTEPWFAFGEGDVWTLFHSFAFDFSVWEIWGALLFGGRLVVVPHLVSRAPKAFYEVLLREGVTVLNQTPSAFRQLIDAEPEGIPEDLALRAVIFGGEALDLQSLRPWLDRHGDSRPALINMYGITETTVHVTYRPIRRSDLETASGSLIGAPLPDLEIFILDRHRQPVPTGVVGEMYVGGAGLARGYLGRPDLTADRFIPHPFSDRPGARLYRTGDLARALPGGDIQYLGRIDSQVKIRGFRIELGEIEATLEAHPQIRQAIVLVRESPHGEKRLVAYVVPVPGAAVTVPDLLALARRRLPEHMVPAGFVLLEHLPLTAHGKLDRRALPEPAHEPSEGVEAPRNPIEATLAAIWADLLGRERVGVRDNFFDLGGHSLLTTRLTSRIREVFHVDLPLLSLFEHPVLSDMAILLEQAIWARPARSRPRFENVRTSRDGVIPLTMAQQRVWILQQLDPESPVFNLPKLVRLTGRLDVRALEAAFGEMCWRHESLRTSVREVEGRLVQVIHPISPLCLPLIDLSALPGGVREPEVQRLAREESLRSFDLVRDSLLRMGLLRESDEAYVLLYTMHHIVSDEWSMDVLRRELVAIYEAFAEGRPSPFVDPPFQYADYALWQQEWLKSESFEAELAYWRRQLAGPLPVLELSMRRSRPEVPSYRGGSVSFALPESLSQALKVLSRREGTTLFMTLLAAYKALLHLYTGQSDILVGTNIANRDHLTLESLIGCLSNVLALRTNISGAPSFRELLGRVRDVALGAYGHQNVPFEALLAELRPERRGTFAPLFQALFVWRQIEELALPAPTMAESGAVNFDLTLVMAEVPGGLWGAVEYASDLFERETAARIVEDFQSLLAIVADNPERQLGDVLLLSQEKNQALKGDFNADFD